MSAEITTPSTALTVQQRVVVAFRSEQTEKDLKEMAASSAHIRTITNKAGYDQCHSLRMALKRARLAVTETGEATREEARKFANAVIAEEKRLIALVSAEETRLKAIQDAYDAKEEAEKQERIAIEQRRVAAIHARIETIRASVMTVALASPDDVLARLAEIDATVIDESFEEFLPAAEAAKKETLERLQGLHAAATARVAEQARLRSEREELDRLRAAQAKRDAEESERLAAERRQQEETAKAERNRLAAEERAAAERIATQEREARQIREQAEREAREIREREEALLAAQRAEIARQQEELRLAKEPPPVVPIPTVARRPSDAEIIAAVAEHFGVSAGVAIHWLAQIDLSVAA